MVSALSVINMYILKRPLCLKINLVHIEYAKVHQVRVARTTIAAKKKRPYARSPNCLRQTMPWHVCNGRRKQKHRKGARPDLGQPLLMSAAKPWETLAMA